MLRRLEPAEINQVLNSNFKIWSPGLSRAQYRHYQWWQLCHSWGRRHLEYWGYFNEDAKLVASCKRYLFEYGARGKVFHVAGIGAVYVPEEHRGHDYARQMLDQLADLCMDEGFDALTLNSDIDPDYYAELGFQQFDAKVFSLNLSEAWLNSAILKMLDISDPDLDESFNVRAIQMEDFVEMNRHHARWLSARPYGMKRTAEYYSYKVGRELYLFQHSNLNWPKLEIITDNFNEFVGGYALIEQAGSYLRVLEVVGSDCVFNSLWSEILRLAQRRHIKTLRGWEIVRPPLKELKLQNRDWSFPMICPLQEDLEEQLISWTEHSPPVVLELDHF